MKAPIVTTFLLAALGLGLSILGPGKAHAKAFKPCGMEGSLTLLCGPEGVEDMQQIPGTNWVIGSGMAHGDTGGLRLIDIAAKTWTRFYPNPAAKVSQDKTDYFKCPGAPDPKTFSAHGIALKETGPKTYQVLAVNHAREAVEVFNVDTKSGTPEITWIGCVIMPDQVYMNSVTFLPKDGFAVTQFYNRSDKRGMLSIFAGEDSGGVYEWHTQLGVTEVPHTDLSGANGIAVSPDGKWLYVAAWGAHQIVRFSLGEGERKKDVVDVDFSPDNVRWAPDGSLLVAGQHSTRDPEAASPIYKGWEVVKLDPKTMKATKIAEGSTESKLQGVSNAIDINGTLWLGAFSGDVVGYMPMP